MTIALTLNGGVANRLKMLARLSRAHIRPGMLRFFIGLRLALERDLRF